MMQGCVVWLLRSPPQFVREVSQTAMTYNVRAREALPLVRASTRRNVPDPIIPKGFVPPKRGADAIEDRL